MASNLLKLKRSAVAGKIPGTADLELGELALNTHDGYVYLKKYDGIVEEIVRSVNNNDSATLTGLTLSNGTANGVAYLNGSKVLTTGTALTFDGTSAFFADNSKAIFGASSDLEIYHDGSNSRIQESGTGNLIIRADNFRLQSVAGESYIEADANGAVALRHDNSQKLSTTSTGIDVTGAVTADGLTVNSGLISSNISIRNSGTSFLNIYSDLNGVSILDVDSNNTGAAPRFQVDVGDIQTFRIQKGGDIAFYEPTGTTAKFFWDASTERLGIGTSSPTSTLDVVGVGGGNGEISVSRVSGATLRSQAQAALGVIGTTTNHSLQFMTNNGGRMTITTAGNVGIGTSSPSGLFTVANLSNTLMELSDDSNRGKLKLYRSGGTAYTQLWHNGTDAQLITTAGAIGFANNSTELMRITATGKVSIGTTRETERLNLPYSSYIGWGYSSSDSQSYHKIGKPNDGAGPLDFSIAYASLASAEAFSFTSGNFGRLITVLNSGNFGIGTATPGSKLAVNGSITESTDGVNYYNVVTQQDIGTEPNEIPLNQYLGSMAYQNTESITVTDLRVDGNLTVVGSQTLAGNVALGDESGDTLTINAGTTTLTQGTANSVLYLNGSKAVTSGSALTFDGYRFIVNIGGTTTPMRVVSNSTASLIDFKDSATTADFQVRIGAVGDHAVFYANGSEQMRLTSTGLGIGTSTPYASLHTAGPIRSTFIADGSDYIGWGSGGGSPKYAYMSATNEGVQDVGLAFYVTTNAGTTNTEAMRIDDVGNVGIGTSTPANELHVNGIGGTAVRISTSSTSLEPKIVFIDGSGDYATIEKVNRDIKIRCLNTDVAYFANSGNVGIGTTSPTHNLHIVKNAGTNFFKTERTDTAAYFTIDHSSLFTNFDTNDRYVFKQNGTETVRINSGGNVGIGIAAPSYPLHVVTPLITSAGFRNSAAAASQILVGNTAGDLLIRTLASGDGLIFSDVGKYLAFGSNGATEKMRLTSDGKVGIGTSNPTSLFMIRGGAATATISSSTNTANLDLINSTQTTRLSATNTNFAITHNSINALSITNTGNVGVGTTAPARNIHVQGTGEVARFQSTNSTVEIRLYSTGPDYSVIGHTGDLYFGVGGAERMRITSTGNVGIGTTTPDIYGRFYGRSVGISSDSSTVLQIRGTSYGGIDIGDATRQFSMTSSSSLSQIGTVTNTPISFFTNSTERLRIISTGNVGIGTSTPAAKLQVEEVGIETTTTAVTNTTQTSVFSYPTASFRTAELMCQIVDSTNSQYHSVKMFIIHDGTNTWFNETNVIHSHAELGTLTVDILSGNVRLLFTAAAASTKSIKVAATMLTS